MNEKNLWIWFVAGLIPHHFKKQSGRNGYTLEVQALFWSLHYATGEWAIHVPLLKWLQHSIWASVINGNVIWLWFVAGLIPYHFKKQLARGRLTVEIQALFWSLHYAARKWVIHVPLIERLRNAIHEAVDH